MDVVPTGQQLTEAVPNDRHFLGGGVAWESLLHAGVKRGDSRTLAPRCSLGGPRVSLWNCFIPEAAALSFHEGGASPDTANMSEASSVGEPHGTGEWQTSPS